MKQFKILLCAALVALAFTACGEKGNDEDGGITKMTWKALVEKYPFLTNFPGYGHDIDMHSHTSMSSIESVSFFDYDCPKANFDEYRAEIEKTDFQVRTDFSGQGGTVTYEKEVDKTEYILQLTYSANNLSAIYSVVEN